MPKRLTEHDYHIAFRIYTGEIKSIDPHEDQFDIISKKASPEQEVIKRDSFNKLSTEAKEVVNFILSQPAEVLEIISTPAMKKITKKRISKHLSKVFHSKFLSNKIIEEISNWVKSF